VGGPSGLAVDDQLLLKLADMKSDGLILPPPTMTVETRVLDGQELAVVTVLASDAPPVRCRGTIFVRIGPRRGIATAQDERVLNERRRSSDRPFDVQPLPSATIADLDVRFFEEQYLSAAFSREVLAQNERTITQRLAATKMIVDDLETTPTVLGVLVLSHRTRDFLPGAYVQFLQVDGTELADPIIDDSDIDGPIADVIRGLDQKIESHNRTSVEFHTSTLEQRRSTYPMAAIQQLVRNAIMHRTYEASNAPVRVTWYRDRLEITSPGGPFGAVTSQNFGKPGVTDYRNPALAESLKVLGFVQKFGAGIATARRLLEENGNPPPIFIVDESNVHVTIGAAR